MINNKNKDINNKKKMVDINLIVPNKNDHFNIEEDGRFEQRVEIIKKDGIPQDLLVKPESEDGTYELLGGYREVEAAKRAGITHVNVKINDEVMSRSKEIGAIARDNGGLRGDTPYYFALLLKELYQALEEEGAGLNENERKNLAKGTFKIIPRTMFNYDMLSYLPEDILLVGQKKYLTRDQGIKLATLLKDKPRAAERVFNSIREIMASASETKAKDIEALLMGRREAKKKEAAAKVDVFKTVKKVEKVLSLLKDLDADNIALPQRQKKTQELCDMCDKVIEYATKCKEKCEERMTE